MRLQKFLSSAGIASRRKCEELILEGKIKVNGQVVCELGTKIDPLKDEVKYNDKKVELVKEEQIKKIEGLIGESIQIAKMTDISKKELMELVDYLYED